MSAEIVAQTLEDGEFPDVFKITAYVIRRT
jgi:hypothetical protein